MSETTVYSTPNCQQCRLTYRALDAAGITYRIVDLSLPENSAAVQYVTEELRYIQAPIVVSGDDDENHWSGFRPDKISQLSQ